MNDYIELRSIIGSVLRRWWLVLLLGALFAALGFFVTSRQAPVYQATTSLLIGRSIQSSNVDRFDLQTSQQLGQTYAELALRQPVLQRTIDELGLTTSWTQLRNRVRSGVSGDTQLLEIRVDAPSPREAEAIADEIARQLILLSPTGEVSAHRREAQAFARERTAELREKIRAGQEQAEQLEEQLLTATSVDSISQLSENLRSINELVATWENNYLQLLQVVDTQSSTNNLAILESAQAGPNPVRPKPRLAILIATLVGMALAIGLIFLLEFLDTSIKTPQEVARLLDLPTLGAINPIKGRAPRDALVVNHEPFSPALESYRLLRTKVQFISVDHPGKTVMVTSPGRGEGKSLTVANLGIAMAQAGLKTVVVDSNLRQPVMQDLFQLSNQEGLTHLLRGQGANVGSYLQPTLVPNLKVLPSGATPSNPSELLGSRRMSEVLKEIGKVADIIICDAPEAVTVADASVMSNKMDGVILILDSGKTNSEMAVQAVANLRDAGANILGAVLNRAGSRSQRGVYTKSVAAQTNSQSAGSDDALTYAESAGV